MAFLTAFVSSLPVTSNLRKSNLLVTTKKSTSKPRHNVTSNRKSLNPQATIVRPGASPSPTDLETFTHAVRGEWVGYEGQFDIETGNSLPVPDYYIPEQFTEWGLTPHGFECNHSIIVRGSTLYRKFFRVLPTVSLFADHVDLEEDLISCDVGGPDGVHVFTDGSFCSGPEKVSPRRESKLEKWPVVDICVRDPRKDVKRATHVRMKFDFENRKFVDDLRVIVEKYSCIYCDGADIEGSSGYVEGWVVGQKGSAEQLEGDWKIVHGDNNTEEILKRPNGGFAHTPSKILYLPEGLDVGVMDNEDENQVVVHVGWLVDENTRIVVRRCFGEDGRVSFSQRFVEHRV